LRASSAKSEEVSMILEAVARACKRAEMTMRWADINSESKPAVIDSWVDRHWNEPTNLAIAQAAIDEVVAALERGEAT
jgi:hypothetical protein